MVYIPKNVLDKIVERLEIHTPYRLIGDNHRERLADYNGLLEYFELKRGRNESFDDLNDRLIEAFHKEKEEYDRAIEAK